MKVSANFNDHSTCHAVTEALRLIRSQMFGLKAICLNALSLSVDTFISIRSTLPDAILVEMPDEHGYWIIHDGYILLEITE